VCICSFNYPGRKAHAPHCHLQPVWLYHIFPHYLINGTILGKEVMGHKICFDLAYGVFLKHFSQEELGEM
jgi:hypothetical protein